MSTTISLPLKTMQNLLVVPVGDFMVTEAKKNDKKFFKNFLKCVILKSWI